MVRVIFLFAAVYVAFVMGMSTVSTMVAILVLYYHHHLPNSRPPRIVRLVLLRVRGRGGRGWYRLVGRG